MRLIDADAFERAVMFSDDEDIQDVIYRLRDFPTAQLQSTNDCISRQAAIDEFDGVKVDEENCTEYDIGYNDGIDFAISKLSVLPTAQPERKAFEEMSDTEFEKWLHEHGICNPDIHESIPCSAVPLLIDNAINELSTQPEYEAVTPRQLHDNMERGGLYEWMDWFQRAQFLNEMGYVICKRKKM